MTSKTEKFFTWVWRINGVILLVLTIVCLVGLFALITESGLFGTKERPRNQLAEVAGANVGAEDLSLGGFRQMDGTDVLYATLAAPSKFRGSGSARGNSRNWLFFDIGTRTAHWLFEDASKEIIDHQFLYQYDENANDASGKPERIVAGIAMLVTDAYDESEPSDEMRIILVSADGKLINAVAESVGGMLDYFYVSNSSQLLLYSRDGSVRIMDVNPKEATVSSDSELSTEP